MENIPLPIIPAQRIRLRGLSRLDVDAIYEIFSDPAVMRYWSTTPLPDKAAAETLTEEIIHDVNQGKMMKWGVALNSNDRVIGTVTLFNIDLENGRAEVGYALAQAYWRQGYINEALQVLFKFAFEVLRLRRLEADVDPRNQASIRTVERLGFQQEGFLRERWHVAGEIQDALFYGLLKRDFRM